MDESNNPAVLRFSSGTLEYIVQERPLWKIVPSSLAAIGEYHTGNDPLIVDHFLLFVVWGGTFHQASYHAQGRDEALADLGHALGTTLRCRLSDPTGFDCRILWPKQLLTAPLFAFRRFEKRSLWGKIRDTLGIDTDDLELSRAVLKHARDRK